MDLRSGHPYWPIKNGLPATYPPLTQNERCEVAVLGAGITGALVAYHLVAAGVDAIVLDKRDVATGSTAASTALLQYAADTELIELIPRVGEPQALRSYRLGLEAVDAVEAIVAKLRVDCGFERKKSLYLASKASHVKRLREEFEIRARAGFEVEFLDSKALEAKFPFRAPAAILTNGDGQLDAFQLTHEMLRHSAERGLRVYDRTEVTRIVPGKATVVLSTDRGRSVTARRVVFATGYESKQFLKRDVGTLESTFAAISEPFEPFPSWPDRCLIWETARPYFYARATADNRVLIGGSDAPYATDHARDQLLKRKTTTLRRRFQRMFPQSDFEVAYAWGGTFGSTKDGLAYIGQVPEWPHAYFALGYGGNGITMSVVAAQLIVDHYLGRPNVDAELFRFDR